MTGSNSIFVAQREVEQSATLQIRRRRRRRRRRRKVRSISTYIALAAARRRSLGPERGGAVAVWEGTGPQGRQPGVNSIGHEHRRQGRSVEEGNEGSGWINQSINRSTQSKSKSGSRDAGFPLVTTPQPAPTFSQCTVDHPS
jgi:hypothetical protein